MFRINVGGTIYTTLKSTLINAGGLLQDIAEHPENFAHDPYNHIPFLDRNPARFERILDLCRHNGCSIRKKLPVELLNDVRYLDITTRIPFRFEAGDQIELTNNSTGIANTAWIVEITLHDVSIKTHTCVVLRCRHEQIWNGETWSFVF